MAGCGGIIHAEGVRVGFSSSVTIELMKLKLHQNRLNVKANLDGGSISSALSPRLFPSALPFTDALHRVPASVRAIVLQGTSPLACESLVATRSVARLLEKNIPE